MIAAFSRILFGVAGTALMLLAAALVGYGGYRIIQPNQRLDFAMLDAIGYVVIAIAVFDVAKYLIEEEVIREREMRRAGEARRSLTRFVATIIIITFLEAVLLIFKVSREDVPNLVYPALLLFAGVALLLGLGVFQVMSAKVEQDVGEEAGTGPDKDEV
jgi:heme A synthase